MGICFRETGQTWAHRLTGFKRRQYLPRPERGGGQVLFRLALGRASLSGSGSSLLFFGGPAMQRKVTLSRVGELLRKLFQILMEQPEGMPAGEALARLRRQAV